MQGHGVPHLGLRLLQRAGSECLGVIFHHPLPFLVLTDSILKLRQLKYKGYRKFFATLRHKRTFWKIRFGRFELSYKSSLALTVQDSKHFTNRIPSLISFTARIGFMKSLESRITFKLQPSRKIPTEDL